VERNNHGRVGRHVHRQWPLSKLVNSAEVKDPPPLIASLQHQQLQQASR